MIEKQTQIMGFMIEDIGLQFSPKQITELLQTFLNKEIGMSCSTKVTLFKVDLKP